jgi:hypothetical protein
MFSQTNLAGGPEKIFSAGPELAPGGPERVVEQILTGWGLFPMVGFAINFKSGVLLPDV